MKVNTTAGRQGSAKRLPVFNQRGYAMRAGDWFKVQGKNNWWRFVAYVIPGEGRESYVEAIELRGASGKVVNGGLRCLDAGSVREVKS